ncbi:hypothetical protein [Lacinutrix salivirga]
MLNQLKACGKYYKKVAILSLLINIIVMLASAKLIIVLLIKLFLLAIFWFLLDDATVRRRIKFYKMAKFSNVKLLGFIFIYDCVFSMPILMLLKEYI